ncbi:MAG: DUF6029 family protein [bacterium]
MKKNLITKILIILVLLVAVNSAKAQDVLNGRLSGNFQIEAQSYTKDSLIGAPAVNEKVLSNSFLNLIYTTANLEVGARYEAYMGPMLGYDPRYKGQGVSYLYGRYHNEMIDITAGDFYEQFGSGIIFRAYEQRQIGYDNAVNGVRFKIKPIDGVQITALAGKQRFYWEQYSGYVRGGDLNINWNDLIGSQTDAYNWTMGASVISKFQADEEPFYNLPSNVLAYSVRSNIQTDKFSVEGEYAYKYNDPNSVNKMSFNPGRGLIASASYIPIDGLSASLNYHWIDNMDFRLDRTVTGLSPALNFIPPLTKQQTYRLATAYPFGTQLTGETGIQGEITYKVPKKSLLGGKYGTDVNFNYSRVYNTDSTNIDDFTYDSPFLGIGKRLLFQELNIDLTRKWNSKLKSGLTYINQTYDKDYCEFANAAHYGKIHSNILILDNTYKFENDHALRLELQHMWAKQDSVLEVPDNLNGNWAMALLEYTIAPKFFFAVSDEYNYGNQFTDRQLHYYSVSAGYIAESTRIQVSWGRQRDGVVCVGGVCRYVPATNGVYLSISSSF